MLSYLVKSSARTAVSPSTHTNFRDSLKHLYTLIIPITCLETAPGIWMAMTELGIVL